MTCCCSAPTRCLKTFARSGREWFFSAVSRVRSETARAAPSQGLRFAARNDGAAKDTGGNTPNAWPRNQHATWSLTSRLGCMRPCAALCTKMNSLSRQLPTTRTTREMASGQAVPTAIAKPITTQQCATLPTAGRASATWLPKRRVVRAEKYFGFDAGTGVITASNLGQTAAGVSEMSLLNSSASLLATQLFRLLCVAAPRSPAPRNGERARPDQHHAASHRRRVLRLEHSCLRREVAPSYAQSAVRRPAGGRLAPTLQSTAPSREKSPCGSPAHGRTSVERQIGRDGRSLFRLLTGVQNFAAGGFQRTALFAAKVTSHLAGEYSGVPRIFGHRHTAWSASLEQRHGNVQHT